MVKIERFNKRKYCLNVDFLNSQNIYVGYSTKRWSIYGRCFILYKTRNFYIINIIKTISNLRLSLLFISNVSFNRGKVVIVNSDKKFRSCMYSFQKITRQFFFNFSWIGGLITNFREFFFLQKREKRFVFGNFWTDKRLGFFSGLTRLPDVAVFLGTYFNRSALVEFQHLGLPIIAISNTDVNPSGINFVLGARDTDFLILYIFLLIFVEGIISGYYFERVFYFRKVKRLCYLSFLRSNI